MAQTSAGSSSGIELSAAAAKPTCGVVTTWLTSTLQTRPSASATARQARAMVRSPGGVPRLSRATPRFLRILTLFSDHPWRPRNERDGASVVAHAVTVKDAHGTVRVFPEHAKSESDLVQCSRRAARTSKARYGRCDDRQRGWSSRRTFLRLQETRRRLE